MSSTIFCDNLIEGHWFKNLSPLLGSANFRKIGSRGTNPDVIEELIKFDRPDIILLDDGHPILVVEKTQEVPTGHNVGQRIARLVRSLEMGVPTIKFFPFDAMKHGEYAGVCNMNIRLLKAFEKMSEIHEAPMLAVNWPCDEYHELRDDGSEDDVIRRLVNDYLANGNDSKCKAFSSQIAMMKKEYDLRLQRRRSYAQPPPSVRIMRTHLVLNEFGAVIDDETAQALVRRQESVVYKMGMNPSKCRREDPYTGTQFIYDYLWCRNGSNPTDKHRNLILHFPKITQSHWYQCNPNDEGRKSCNWYLTANALVFLDSASLLRP